MTESVLDFLAGLPTWLYYMAITFIPWIELRGAVPVAVAAGDRVYLPLILIVNWVVFFPTYFILEFFYDHIPVDSWLHRKLQKIREKGHRLVERYGVWGLVIFVAVPLPGTGAYSGTCAAWLLDVEWKRAFLAVGVGVTIAFFAVWGLAELAVAGIELL
jgi:uncharacterized membrane protein